MAETSFKPIGERTSSPHLFSVIFFSLASQPRLLVSHHALSAVNDVILAHISLSGRLRPPVSTTAHLLGVIDVAFRLSHRSLFGRPRPPVSTTAHPLRAEDDAFNAAHFSLSGLPRLLVSPTTHQHSLIGDATLKSTVPHDFEYLLASIIPLSDTNSSSIRLDSLFPSLADEYCWPLNLQTAQPLFLPVQRMLHSILHVLRSPVSLSLQSAQPLINYV